MKKQTTPFTPQEIGNMLALADQHASKVVIEALILAIRESPAAGYDPAAAASLAAELTAYSGSNIAYMKLGIDGAPVSIGVTLAFVARDHKPNISVPSEDYAKDLFAKYNLLKQMAIAYWKQFQISHAELCGRIFAFRSEIKDLVIDPQNPTTLYFLPETTRRVGIFAFYIDKNGAATGLTKKK